MLASYKKKVSLETPQTLLMTECTVRLNYGYKKLVYLRLTSYELFKRIKFLISLFPSGRKLKKMKNEIEINVLKNLNRLYIKLMVNNTKHSTVKSGPFNDIDQSTINGLTLLDLLQKILYEFSVFNQSRGFTQALAVLQLYERFNNKGYFAGKIARYLFSIFNSLDGYKDGKSEYSSFVNKFSHYFFHEYGVMTYNHLVDILSKSSQYCLTLGQEKQAIGHQIVNLLKYNPIQDQDILRAFVRYFNQFESKEWISIFSQLIYFSNIDLRGFIGEDNQRKRTRVNNLLKQASPVQEGFTVVGELVLEADYRLLLKLLTQLDSLKMSENCEIVVDNFKNSILCRFSLPDIMTRAFEDDISSFSKIFILLIKYNFVEKEDLEGIDWNILTVKMDRARRLTSDFRTNSPNSAPKTSPARWFVDELFKYLLRDQMQWFIDYEALSRQRTNMFTLFKNVVPDLSYLCFKHNTEKFEQCYLIVDNKSRTVTKWHFDSFEFDVKQNLKRRTMKSSTGQKERGKRGRAKSKGEAVAGGPGSKKGNWNSLKKSSKKKKNDLILTIIEEEGDDEESEDDAEQKRKTKELNGQEEAQNGVGGGKEDAEAEETSPNMLKEASMVKNSNFPVVSSFSAISPEQNEIKVNRSKASLNSSTDLNQFKLEKSSAQKDELDEIQAYNAFIGGDEDAPPNTADEVNLLPIYREIQIEGPEALPDFEDFFNEWMETEETIEPAAKQDYLFEARQREDFIEDHEDTAMSFFSSIAEVGFEDVSEPEKVDGYLEALKQYNKFCLVLVAGEGLEERETKNFLAALGEPLRLVDCPSYWGVDEISQEEVAFVESIDHKSVFVVSSDVATLKEFAANPMIQVEVSDEKKVSNGKKSLVSEFGIVYGSRRSVEENFGLLLDFEELEKLVLVTRCYEINTLAITSVEVNFDTFSCSFMHF